MSLYPFAIELVNDLNTLTTVPPASIDLTGIASAVIAGVFTILGIVIPLWLQSHMKDKQAAIVLGNAIQNSLGIVQQAVEADIKQRNPKLLIPGVPPTIAVGVHYVMNHAGKEAQRFGLSHYDIAEKINAKIGLENIKRNIAAAANPTSTSTTPTLSVVSAITSTINKRPVS